MVAERGKVDELARVLRRVEHELPGAWHALEYGGIKGALTSALWALGVVRELQALSGVPDSDLERRRVVVLERVRLLSRTLRGPAVAA